MKKKENPEAEERKRKTKKESPVLKNVVSLRVSDREKRLLERVTAATSQNVSDLVREALAFWLSRPRKTAAKANRAPIPQSRTMEALIEGL